MADAVDLCAACESAERAGGEIQLTDGIARLMDKESVYAYRFTGKRFDCGNKLGYLQATVEYGMNHPKLGEPFREYLRALMASTALR